MRYTRIGGASYLLAFILVGVALVFAAARSQRRGEQEAAEWRRLGRQTYDSECGSCHPDGRGRGAPALRGLAVEL
ncbi:MAG: hypothetical protein ACYC8T_38550, partial [Myxococcaceae bacterium]